MDNIKTEISVNTVGIIVPVYKVEEYLKFCVHSIASQTYTDWLLILVDDGSPDSCPKMCDEYAEQDKRIRVVHKENGGLVSAWKAGLMALPEEIEYVAFVDSDDWISETFLEELVKKAREYGADVVIGNLVKVCGDRRITTARETKGYYDKKKMMWEFYPHILYNGKFHGRAYSVSRCGKLFKKLLVMDNVRYCSDETTYAEDLNITFPVMIDAESVYFLEKGRGLYYYRLNPKSMTQAYDRNMRKSIDYVYNSLMEIIRDKGAVELFEKQVCADYLAASVQYVKNTLLHPKGFFSGRREIDSYIYGNSFLKRSISVSQWRHYSRVNMTIIRTMRDYNWFNRNVTLLFLYFMKRLSYAKIRAGG